MEDESAGAAAVQTSAAAHEWLRDWGSLLRTARQVSGLSLTELSARTGLSKGYLSKLESGSASAANPSRATLAALGRALPSFRPLAYTLEAGAPLGALALAPLAPTGPDATADPDAVPLALGWRELEVLVALLVLDRAALVTPLTAPVVARAVGRSVATIAPVLERLTRQGLLRHVPPLRPGAPPTYELAATLPERLGIERLGDTLVLAAALLAQGAALHRRER